MSEAAELRAKRTELMGVVAQVETELTELMAEVCGHESHGLLAQQSLDDVLARRQLLVGYRYARCTVCVVADCVRACLYSPLAVHGLCMIVSHSTRCRDHARTLQRAGAKLASAVPAGDSDGAGVPASHHDGAAYDGMQPMTRADRVVERALNDVVRLTKRRSKLGDAGDSAALYAQLENTGGIISGVGRGSDATAAVSEEERARQEGVSSVDPLLAQHSDVSVAACCIGNWRAPHVCMAVLLCGTIVVDATSS